MKPIVPGAIDPELPILKSEIRSLIPHAGNMCLLDAVLEWDDKSILCSSETHRDPGNPLRRDQQLSPVHAFEYGAQAAAIHGGLRAQSAGASVPACYLAALRHACVYVDRLDTIMAPLEVDARRLFGDTGNTVYQCRISAGGTLIAEGRVIIMMRP